LNRFWFVERLIEPEPVPLAAPLELPVGSIPIELVCRLGKPTPLFKPVLVSVPKVPGLKPLPAVIPVEMPELFMPPPNEPAPGLAAPPTPAPAPPPPVSCAKANVEPRARAAANVIVASFMVLSFLERWDNNRDYSIVPKIHGDSSRRIASVMVGAAPGPGSRPCPDCAPRRARPYLAAGSSRGRPR
jgi:hypothetical protein